MAHEIETAMFVGRPAWHGLGVVLENAPSIAEAIKLAGLDWNVIEKPLYLADRTKVTTHRAMVRDTDGTCLGVVGNGFTPLQNAEAFAWFQPILETGECTIEAAGSLREGRRIWILAAIKDGTVEVQRGDAVRSHVLLAHGHDGSLSLRVGFTKTRVVCANTLAVARRQDATQQITVKHTTNVVTNLDKVRETFDMQRAELKKGAEQYRFLAARKCDDKNLVRYVREVLKPGAADDDKIKVRNVDEICELFTTGQGAEMSRGTMWGAFNAVTEYATHHRGRGDSDKSQDARQNSNWFGGGQKLTDRAFDLALQFAEDAPMAEQSRAAYANHASAKAETDFLLSRPVAAKPAPAAPESPIDEGSLLGSLLKGKPARINGDESDAA